MTNNDSVEAVDSFINVLASLPADEQATALFNFVVDADEWQPTRQTDTDGRAR